MTPNVLGLDLGLARAGAARITRATTAELARVHTWQLHTEPTGPRVPVAEDAARVRAVARWAVGRATTSTVLVVIEGPAHNAEHGFPHERAGAWWLVVDAFTRLGLPIAVVAPNTAKRYIAGHGHSDKDTVRRHVDQAWPGRGLARVTYDEADSAALATCGVDWLGWPGPWLAGRRGASLLTAVRWPDRASVRE